MFLRFLVLGCSLLAGIGSARHAPNGCATHREGAREALFLNARHVEARAKAGVASRRALATVAQDIGDIAVMPDTEGVVGRRNVFNLDRRTLIFRPQDSAATRYRYSLGGDTFDSSASANGAQILGLGDDDTREIALPFAFPFFGTTHRTVFVNSDGNLTFSRGDAANLSRSFGNMVGGAPRIAALFTDLDPTFAASGVRVLIETSRVAISWAQVPLYSDFGFGAQQNFQVRLYADGRIELAWQGSNSPDAVVGIAPGGVLGTSTLVDFASTASAEYSAAVGERFASGDEIDIVAASQRFYETHDDAYDYLVFYNDLGIAAAPGAVAYEVTVRNDRSGYGDQKVEFGSAYGSPRRLQAALNLGDLSQYPLNPNAVVPGRFLSGDTPLTVLAHEAGHLFLSFASIREPANPTLRPMLGRAGVHWAFTYNSEASILEGNRIADRGITATPRFQTIGTVEQFSPLDQYLMGLRAPEEVPAGFVVYPATTSASRSPQIGVVFDGTRRDFGIEEIIAVEGRRTPDHTVAQRRFRFAFVLITAAGGAPSPAALDQLERYRQAFAPFFAAAASGRATADTTLRRSVQLSAAPATGVVAGATAPAAVVLDRPASRQLTISLSTTQGFTAVPAEATIPAGASRAAFNITGVRAGVEELTAVPSDPSYESGVARVQVAPGVSSLRLSAISASPNASLVRAADINNIPYAGIRLRAAAVGGSVEPVEALTGENGQAAFRWTGSELRVSIAGAPDSIIQLTPFGRPAIREGGIVNAASFDRRIAPGGFATIFGISLGSGIAAGFSSPFPLRVGGVEVFVNGTAAGLHYVSDSQINIVVPPGIASGPVEVTVLTPAGVATARTTISTVAPGIFFNASTGLGAVLRNGEFLEIYCTGLGAVERSGGFDRTVNLPAVSIGGLDAPVSFSGLHPGTSGLYQVNARIPPGLAGRQPLTLVIGGVTSNTVTVEIR